MQTKTKLFFCISKILKRNSLPLSVKVLFKFSRFTLFITKRKFEQMSHFSSLKSRSPSDGRMSCPSQNDVTLADKATVTFCPKTHIKRCWGASSVWLTLNCFVTVATKLSTRSHNFVSFFDAKIYFSDKNEWAFGFLS